MNLGDAIESALNLVGVTKERVVRWVGKPCGCEERQEKLNQLGRWASRILAGKTQGAEDYLTRMLEQKE